ncbi:hypothetical protein F2B00_12275 [Streptomyces parvus]|nr:hypothetical protein F2B00_12275 [Streptomyces parvus]
MRFGHCCPGEGVELVEDFAFLVVLVLLVLVPYACLRAARNGFRNWRLPPPTIRPAQVEHLEKAVFREICRRAKGPGSDVDMQGHFDEQGWNRGDATLILAEPLKHKLISVRGWSRAVYFPTRRGWNEYRRRFMMADSVSITASPGGFVAANINSAHGVAQSGYGHRADRHDVSHQHLVEALRTDARAAEPSEGVRAQEYADDLAEAVQEENPARVDRILSRVNALLETATSAFSLTRGLLPPGTL